MDRLPFLAKKAPVSHAAQCSGPGFVLQVSKGDISDQRVPGGLEVQINYKTNNRIKIQKTQGCMVEIYGKGASYMKTLLTLNFGYYLN